MSILKRIGLALFLIVGLPFAGIAALEGLLSVAALAHDALGVRQSANVLQIRYDSTIGWVATPSLSRPDNYGPHIALTTSADGMRIHRPLAPPAAGERRILCSGDEYTFGPGVPDEATYCADLESAAPGVSTVNLAARGYGVDQQYLRYKRDGSRYPHQVHLFALDEVNLQRLSQASVIGYPKPRLRLTGSALGVVDAPASLWTRPSAKARYAEVLNESRLVRLFQRTLGGGDSASAPRAGDRTDVADAVFRDIGLLSKARGSTLVLVYLPTRNDLLPGRNDVERARLATFSAQSSIPLVDLTPEMRGVPADTSDWMFITPNELPARSVAGLYTAKGHRWVADRLAEHLRALHLLDSTQVDGTRRAQPNRR